MLRPFVVGYVRGKPETDATEEATLKNSLFCAGFAVDDIAKAKTFYGETLGVSQVVDIAPGLLSMHAGNGYAVEHYAEGPLETDERGIAQPEAGPKIASFRDPAGNILSLIET